MPGVRNAGMAATLALLVAVACVAEGAPLESARLAEVADLSTQSIPPAIVRDLNNQECYQVDPMSVKDHCESKNDLLDESLRESACNGAKKDWYCQFEDGWECVDRHKTAQICTKVVKNAVDKTRPAKCCTWNPVAKFCSFDPTDGLLNAAKTDWTVDKCLAAT